MNFPRVMAILAKDLIYGPKSFFFVQAVITPIISALMILLLFGSILSGKPDVGIIYKEETGLKKLVESVEYVHFAEYRSLDDMKNAVLTGKLDAGVIIPRGLDARIGENTPLKVNMYVWGESLLKNRAVISAAVADLFAEMAGKEPLFTVTSETIGDDNIRPLKHRFLPLLVLLATVMSGLIIPGSALVLEKQRQTLTAIRVTPASYSDVILAKCLLGFFMSMISAVLILGLNGSLGRSPGALFLTLAMAAAFTSTFGGLSGILVDNINGFMTVMKSLMLFVYAPGILSLFPKVPLWIPKIFPTYYIFYPILEVSQNGASISEIGLELTILFALILFMGLVISLVSKQKKVQMI